MKANMVKVFGLITFLVVLVFAITACGNNGGVTTTADEFNTLFEVIDLDTSEEIEGANIVIDDYNINSNSDSDGEFIASYEEVQGTLISFEVFMGGYEDYSANFEAGDSTVTVEMQPLGNDPNLDDVDFFSNDGFNLDVNQQAGIEIVINAPDDGSEVISYMSTNVNVATVSQGNITAVGPGTADILVTVDAPGYNPMTWTIVVTVN